ncbi:beta-galactosidase [Kiloniella majae]|uniref:beta-galactosidase n=1 Tax=Kiloniella majae TaxID=1938558 RepID=UPI001C3F6B17|nr:beta-galactosidase [Kiloniella majae]
MSMTMQRTLGTCYYPEHWPEEMWKEDASRMSKAGLTWVRIGEFAWSKLEPKPGELDFGWLDRAMDVLQKADLQVVLGTPTATPPRWMLDKHPDMLAVDASGNPRKFGSRRHYCFSHPGYREESKRITKLLAERYGKRVAAWQTDNEYGCHDTVISYSEPARFAFQQWLKEQYGTVKALNKAWGNVFWSMEYDDFSQIELPNLTVTEPNPAHSHAFRRFSSDQVVTFNRIQADEIRLHSSAPISHNYMGRITDFDHFDVGNDLDFATWDSYPLGFLEDRVGASPEQQRAYAKQGDPDFQAFHHDLYRTVGQGRWWVMEQQPGPVNWAPYNPAPLPGMVRLWSWEAFAHGAETVNYFRWRQASFAQEQMHSGLLRPDNQDAPAMAEVIKVAQELKDAPAVEPPFAQVALVFDYKADWAWSVQPHGLDLSYFDLVFSYYKALRRNGLTVDIIAPNHKDFSQYKLTLVPGLIHFPSSLKKELGQLNSLIIYGPRTGARDKDFNITPPLPPSLPNIDVKVSYVESLRPDSPLELSNGGSVIAYTESLEGIAPIFLETKSKKTIAVKENNIIYCGSWLDDDGLDKLMSIACTEAKIPTQHMPEGVRVTQTRAEEFWFNYSQKEVETKYGSISPAGILRHAV